MADAFACQTIVEIPRVGIGFRQCGKRLVSESAAQHNTAQPPLAVKLGDVPSAGIEVLPQASHLSGATGGFQKQTIARG